jgi:colicin import membrane protein
MATKTTKTVPPSRSQRSKTQVQQEFGAIQQEAEATREVASPKSVEIEQRRAAEVRQSIESVSVDSVAQRIAALNGEVSRTLLELSEKLTAEVDLLARVREAVAFEQQDLERLHKIDIAATSLDQLIEDYARERERLETEIQTRRSEWEQEARTAERERKEADEALRKQRQRESEDYEYRKQLERKKAQDRYDEEIHLLAKKNEERQGELERTWAQREASIAEREEELARLRQQVEEFPQRLAAEKEAALTEATRQVTARYEQQILVLQKDAEAERKVAALQVTALQETLKRQTEQMAVLERATEEAKRQVQDIALKAIEGASGSRALAHVNQIAMEQAKGRPPG